MPLQPKIKRLADWNRIKEKYSCGMRVRARAKSHQVFGLACETEDCNTPAIVRNIEISWIPSNQHAATIPEGSTFTAVVTGHDDVWREVILSIKGADTAPFDRFAECHAIGQVVEATVIRTVPDGYLLQLEGNLEAVLSDDQVPTESRLCKEHFIEFAALLKGDSIRVILLKIDKSTKTISTSLAAYVELLNGEAHHHIRSLSTRQNPTLATLTAAFSQAKEGMLADRPRRVLNILLVDDNEGLRTQLLLALKSRGHVVLESADLVTAKDVAEGLHDLDVILLGRQFEDDLLKIHDSIQDLRVSHGEPAIYLFTANAGALLARSGFYAQAAIDGVIEKPKDVPDIIGMIEGTCPVPTLATFVLERAADLDGPRVRDESFNLEALEEYLTALQDLWKGCTPALLAFDPEVCRVSALRVRGFNPDEINSQGGSLGHSTIGDSLNTGRAFQDSLSSASTAVRRLLQSLKANLVLGFPLQLAYGRRKLGLYIFFDVNRQQGSEPINYAGVQRSLAQIASEMSISIERAQFEREIQHQQRALCVGNLLLGMAHELRNTVQTLEAFRYNIQLSLGARASGRNVPEAALPDSMAGMRVQITSLRDNLEMFLSMGRENKTSGYPLDILLRETVHACADSASQCNVVVDLDLSEELEYPVVSNSLRQAFMNLILNAIQHSAYAPVERGLVQVTGEMLTCSSRRFFAVRVRDNGLGIHLSHLGRIFDMFFTTRTHGTGLGLYVTRKILDSIRATVEIENTFRYGGTTFRVMIPMSQHTRLLV